MNGMKGINEEDTKYAHTALLAFLFLHPLLSDTDEATKTCKLPVLQNPVSASDVLNLV